MNRLRSLWLTVSGSLWFVPSLLVLLGVAAALVLIEMDPIVGSDLARNWPRLFGAGAEGSRGMLTAIATSMITVAGVVFSVTIVALSLTASQYSPRVLRNFMSDRPTQIVLGAFVGVFAYCLIVLRTIRGGDEGAFVPALAVLGGVGMAFVGIGLLIYFVHHVATAIQVDYIVQRIAADTAAAIDRLFPSHVGEEREPDDLARAPMVTPDGPWQDIAATRTGYLLAIDAEALLALAAEHRTVVRVLPRIGDFVVEHMVVAQVATGVGPAHDDWSRTLSRCLTVRAERNVRQDAAYGLQQIVDVALKALSPGVHDPTTAVSCIDHLGALLHHLSGRRVEGGLRECDGQLRLIVPAPAYEDLVHGALSSLTHHASSHESVHARLIAAVENAAAATADRQRLATLARQLEAHVARLSVADLPAASAQALGMRASVLRDGLSRRVTQPAPRTGLRQTRMRRGVRPG